MNHRRRIINSLGALPLLALLRTSSTHAQTSAPGKLSPTPQDTEGPFYPTQWSGEIDGDLVSFNGKDYAGGTLLRIEGTARAIDAAPLVNAQIEIWQVDATGKYRHPNDDREGPAQRGFQGFGRLRTDSVGRYSFRTIKPVTYGGRPAHVHLRVIADGHKTLTTQIYFAGENEERGGFGAFSGFSKERDRLTVKPAPTKDTTNPSRDALAVTFDIVLARG